MSTQPQLPNVPPQDNPPLSDGKKLFPGIITIVWWKFFQSIVDNIQAIWVIINNLAPGTTASYVQDEGTLAGGTTNITSPVATPNVGDSLTVFWKQPSAGAEQITWDAIFQQVTANDNDVRPNRTSAVSFKAKSDNLWYPTAFVMGRT